MLTRQQIEVLDKKKKLIRIRNTFDIGQAMKAAQEATENGGRTGNGSSEIIQMGFIPEEMWLYDPWLMADSLGNRTDISLIAPEREWLMFGLSQGATNRKLFIYLESSQKTQSMEQVLPPLGVFNKLYLYPKIILQGS